jgi:hypothetical protein
MLRSFHDRHPPFLVFLALVGIADATACADYKVARRDGGTADDGSHAGSDSINDVDRIDAGADTCSGGACELRYIRTVSQSGISTDGNINVALAADGSVYLAGMFTGTVDFDPGPGVDTITSRGETDVFVEKFNPDGSHAWVRSVGGESFDFVSDLALAPDGSVTIAAGFQGTVDLDPGPGIEMHTAASQDAFALKLAPDGSFAWARVFSATDAQSFGLGLGVAIGPDSMVYLSGTLTGSVDLDPGAGQEVHTSTVGGGSGYVVKLSTYGNFVWAREFRTNGVGQVDKVAVGGDGIVWLVGSFNRDVDLDPGVGTDMRTSLGNLEMFLVKLDSSGLFSGGGTFDSSGGGTSIPGGLAIAPDNSVYVAGQFSGSVDLDPGLGIVSRASAGGIDDAFIVKLGANGSLLWAHSFGGVGYDSINGLAALPGGGVLAAGGFGSPSVNFSPVPGEGQRSSTDGGLFVLDLNGDKSFGWTAIAGSTSAYATSISVSGRSFAIAGYYNGTGDFDPGPAADRFTASASDAFMSLYSF